MDADAATKWFLKELNVWLRSLGFKRRGQTFAREFDASWQVINVQLSSFSSRDEKSLTINLGVQPKVAIRFRQEEVSKAPLEYHCAIRLRIGRLTQEKGDLWWAISDATSAQVALREITDILGSRGISFLDRTTTSDGMIRLFESGEIWGFKIDRDEAWLLLLAEAGSNAGFQDRLSDYRRRWSLSPAVDRASKFLGRLRDRYGVAEG